MPRRRKVAPEATPLPSPQDAYAEIVEAYKALWKQILVGVTTQKDRDELAKARQIAQRLKDAYPALWEKACCEVEKSAKDGASQ